MIIPKFGAPLTRYQRKFVGNDPKIERMKQIETLLSKHWEVHDIAEALGIPESLVRQTMRLYGMQVPK